MMRFVFLYIIAFSLVFAGHGYAELYQYKDSQGVVHVTDNPGSIPDKYSDSVKIQSEIKSKPAEKRVDEKGRQRQKGPKNRNAAESGGDEERGQQLREERQNLVEQKETLEKEREHIEKQRQGLKNNRPDESASEEERKEYSQKVKDLNDRINAYEEKLKSYEKEVEAFNSKVSKQREDSE